MNEVNLLKLSILQINLDKIILNKHNAKNLKKIKKYKTLALLVEIGELSNETMCFKFWKSNKNIDFAKVREEYSDCVHFILSIGNILKYNFANYKNKAIHKKQETTQIILNLYKYTMLLNSEFNIPRYEKVLDCMLNLAISLKISTFMIEKDYIAKNKINITRQENNY